MASTAASESIPSLLGITVRRSIVTGRLYLVLGTSFTLLYAILLSVASRAAFASTFPLLLPLFAVLGDMGGLMVFTNDRVKGVFEYLVAYGVSPRRLFTNVLIASLVLLSIVAGTGLAAGLGMYLARGHGISTELAGILLLYSLPMSYASAAFAATVGMFWSSLSSPREGMNSPIGLMPMIGIAPSLLTLLTLGVVEASHPTSIYVVTGPAILVIVAVVLVLLSLTDRLLLRERLLSPA